MQVLSDRGHVLVGCDTERPTGGLTVLTVELYEKWYGLYLVNDAGASVRLDLDLLDEHTPEGQIAVADHVFNPIAVERLAEAEGWLLPALAHELLIGRWELEYCESRSTYYQEL